LNATLGNAVLLVSLGATATSFTQMNMGPGENHYYWIRVIDEAGRAGPWFNSGVATVGQSSSDTTRILAQLTTSITDSQLSNALLTKINSGAGSVVAIDQITTELAAMYTIKTQLTAGGRTYVAGIGVGVENTSGIIESQVLVAASRFAIVDPNGTNVDVPFVVTGGVTYIQSAFIANASITNVKISGQLQSDVVNAQGLPLWVLDRGGSWQLNSNGAGSQRMIINSQNITIYDTNGVLRIAMGLNI
jgi:predicted phage tail protein